jgi:hypothetical protein
VRRLPFYRNSIFPLTFTTLSSSQSTSWRYIEWVNFTKTTFPPTPHWDLVLGRELYDHTEQDTIENVAESVNLADSQPDVVAQLSAMLHQGWRSFLPTA